MEAAERSKRVSKNKSMKYQVAEIRRGAMFAQESGNIKIEPLDLDVLAMVRRQPRRTGTIWDLFDDPFFNSAQAVEKHLTTNSLRVNVKPLPPSPEGFCGGVGSFDVKGSCDHQEVKANEAINVALLNVKVALWLFVKTLNTNKDKVKEGRNFYGSYCWCRYS